MALFSLFYIVAVGLLSLHLWHGTDSIFQTLGLRNNAWSACLRKVVAIYCLVYFLGNLAIPGTILTGLVKPAQGTVAHSVIVRGQSLEAAVAAPEVSVTH